MNSKVRYSFIGLGLALAILVSGLAIHPFALAEDGQTIPRVLARGAALHGANGIHFGPDGNLYIASFADGYITVMNPANGHILNRFYPEGGMDGPDDLTFGPDGTLYWTSVLTGKVGKMTPDGTQSLLVQLPPGVNPITFSDDGRLFVALDFLGDALYEVYLDGVTPPRLIRENLGFFNAFDFGPDGKLYGPLYLMNKVIKVDVDTGEIWDVADGFEIPVSARFDASGQYLYVADQGAGEVIRLDPVTGEREVFASLSPGLDNMAFDADGQLFVSSAEDGTIWRVLPSGKGQVLSPGGMSYPGGVAVLPGEIGQDNVYVADLFVLRHFNGQTGQQLNVEYGEFFFVLTVSPDGNNLLISSWLDELLWVYDPVAGSVVETRSDFFGPMNVIRFQGDLLVSEVYTGQVVRSSGPGDRQVLATLAVPIGLAATEDDVWTADWALGAVYQIVQDGVPVMIEVASGLAGPEGLAVMPDGSLLVVEPGADRVSRIDLATGEVTTFAEGLELGAPHPSALPPFYIFNGIAVGEAGTVYVTGDDANVLYRIDQHP